MATIVDATFTVDKEIYTSSAATYEMLTLSQNRIAGELQQVGAPSTPSSQPSEKLLLDGAQPNNNTHAYYQHRGFFPQISLGEANAELRSLHRQFHHPILPTVVVVPGFEKEIEASILHIVGDYQSGYILVTTSQVPSSAIAHALGIISNAERISNNSQTSAGSRSFGLWASTLQRRRKEWELFRQKEMETKSHKQDETDSPSHNSPQKPLILKGAFTGPSPPDPTMHPSAAFAYYVSTQNQTDTPTASPANKLTSSSAALCAMLLYYDEPTRKQYLPSLPLETAQTLRDKLLSIDTTDFWLVDKPQTPSELAIEWLAQISQQATSIHAHSQPIETAIRQVIIWLTCALPEVEPTNYEQWEECNTLDLFNDNPTSPFTFPRSNYIVWTLVAALAYSHKDYIESFLMDHGLTVSVLLGEQEIPTRCTKRISPTTKYSEVQKYGLWPTVMKKMLTKFGNGSMAATPETAIKTLRLLHNPDIPLHKENVISAVTSGEILFGYHGVYEDPLAITPFTILEASEKAIVLWEGQNAQKVTVTWKEFSKLTHGYTIYSASVPPLHQDVSTGKKNRIKHP